MSFAWPRSVINMPDGSVMTPGFRVVRRARRRRGLGDDCPPGNVMAGDPPHCTLTRFVDLNNPTVQMIGQCPVQDLSRNMCMLSNGNQIGCNALRECDSLTGATHFEYGLPGGPSGNVDITVAGEGTPIAGPTNSPLPNPPGLSQQVTPIYPLLSQPSYLPASAQPSASKVVSSNGIPNQVPGAQSNAPGPVYAGGSPGGPLQQLISGTSNSPGSTYIMMPGQASSGFDLSSIPSWVWIALAGVGALMLFKK